MPAHLQRCELYLDHGSARPVFVQGHHLKPEYLQKRLWGEVRHNELIWLCGSCHDTVHGWIYMTMGDWKQTVSRSQVPPRALVVAENAVKWYQSEAA